MFFARKTPRDRQNWNHHKKPPQQHGHRHTGVVPKRVCIQSPECRPVISHCRRIRVQNLRQSVRSRIRDARCAKLRNHCNRRKNQDRQRRHQNRQHGHLHVECFDLLPQVLRCPSHHQSRDKYGQNHKNQNTVQPRAYPAEHYLSQHDVDQRHHASERCQRIVLVVYRATARVCRHRREQRGVRNTKPHFLSFHVSAGLCFGRFRLHAFQERISPCLERIHHHHARQEQRRHGAPHRPAVPSRTCYPPQRVCQPRRNRKNQQQLHKVRQRCWILKRVCAISAKKSSAVRSVHLDRFLRSHRPLRDHLRRHRFLLHATVRVLRLHHLWFNQTRRRVRLQVLDHPLRNEKQSRHQTDRQQHPQKRPRRIHPEIPDGVRFPPRHSPNQGNGQCNPHRRRRKVVVRQTCHLCQVAHRRFTRIRLPVRIRRERHRRIPRQVWRHVRKFLRIPRQPVLYSLN